MKLKEAVKRLCKERGITLAQVEKDLGFSKGYLSKIDQSAPSVNRIKMLAKYFGVALSELMVVEIPDIEIHFEEGYYPDRDTARAAQEAFKNPDLKALFDAAKGASAEDIKAATAVLLALKAKENGGNE